MTSEYTFTPGYAVLDVMTEAVAHHMDSIAATLAYGTEGRELCEKIAKALLATVMPHVLTQLEDEHSQAIQQAGEKIMAETGIRYLAPDANGMPVIDLVAAASFMAEAVSACKTMLGDAENYVEQHFYDPETGQNYLVTITRPGKHTPHQLRRAAEAALRTERESIASRFRAHCEDHGLTELDHLQATAIIRELPDPLTPADGVKTATMIWR